MGIEVRCINKYVDPSYHFWNVFRIETVFATIRYFKSNIENKKYEDACEQEWLNKLTTYMNNMETEFKYNTDLDMLYTKYFQGQFVELLILHGISGLYTLCYKPDTEAYYTVGNAHDMLSLFKLIKPYYDKSNPHYLTLLKLFSAVLRESVKTKSIIYIR